MLLHKLDHLFSINEVISHMQFAFQKGLSILVKVQYWHLMKQHSFIMKEETMFMVFMVFLYVAKAFDSVWQDGLF